MCLYLTALEVIGIKLVIGSFCFPQLQTFCATSEHNILCLINKQHTVNLSLAQVNVHKTRSGFVFLIMSAYFIICENVLFSKDCWLFSKQKCIWRCKGTKCSPCVAACRPHDLTLLGNPCSIWHFLLDLLIFYALSNSLNLCIKKSIKEVICYSKLTSLFFGAHCLTWVFYFTADASFQETNTSPTVPLFSLTNKTYTYYFFTFLAIHWIFFKTTIHFE